MVAEIALAGSALDDREHPGDARAAGDAEDVLVLLGMEGRAAERTEDTSRVARGIAAKQPIREPSARFLLDHEDEPVDVAAEVDHRVGASALDPGNLEHDELAGLEPHRLRQCELEMDHVGCELAHDVDAGGAVLRQGVTVRPRRDLGSDAQNAIAGRAGLAHQDVAFVALELGKSRRLAPVDVGGALHDPRAAGAAGAGRAFVGQGEAPGEAGVEQLVVRPTVEIENAGIGFDGDLHRWAATGCWAWGRGAHALLKKSSSAMSSSSSNS